VTTNITAKPFAFLHETSHGCSVASLTRTAVELSLFQDNDFSYSIPHSVKCRTKVVNNLSRSLETCKMLKIILSRLKRIKILESVIPHQTVFQHQLSYVRVPSQMKSSSHKKPLQIQKLKIKMWGDMAYYFPTV